MLHDTDDVAVACVLVMTVEETFFECLIAANSVTFVHSHFNILIKVRREIREWSKRFVQKLWE